MKIDPETVGKLLQCQSDLADAQDQIEALKLTLSKRDDKLLDATIALNAARLDNQDVTGRLAATVRQLAKRERGDSGTCEKCQHKTNCSVEDLAVQMRLSGFGCTEFERKAAGL